MLVHHVMSHISLSALRCATYDHGVSTTVYRGSPPKKRRYFSVSASGLDRKQ